MKTGIWASLCLMLAFAVAGCEKSAAPNEDGKQAAAAALASLQTGDAADGKALYAACAACHGASGEGNAALGSPSLRMQQEWYLRRQLQNFRAGMRGSHPEDAFGAQMQAIAKTLPNDRAIDSLVAYISSFPSKPAEPTLQGNIKRGGDYYSNLCGACHGPRAEGLDALQAPALSGIEDWYLQRQYLHFRDGVRGADPADRLGFQMGMMGKSLPDDEVIRDVVVYIQSLAD